VPLPSTYARTPYGASDDCTELYSRRETGGGAGGWGWLVDVLLHRWQAGRDAA